MKKRSIGEVLFDTINYIFLGLICFTMLYPMVYVIFASLSDPLKLMAYRGPLLKPIDFTIKAYKLLLNYPMIWIGYRNTIIYVVLGTTLNIFLTTMGGYVLSRKYLKLKNLIMFFIVFTMYFSGGMIPTYVVVQSLGMIDTIWAMIIPGAISTMNLIIMRTGFLSVPDSLEESARMDGAGDWTILFRIMIPLAMPTIAVMILFYAVGHWNAFFNAILYLRRRELYPLQLVLREILIMGDTTYMETGVSDADDRLALTRLIKYAAIVVSTVPILCIYPFLQKYFVKGVMIGAIKE
ncbi:binding-protein-dependent transport systems inner membrane component [Caldicellulosiruptor obsidiansis OB47]|uniref:Binding-protein-dependent transport systems inner membrane component n=1 Tax=Caldicellulosiruptor obsidiansis (strain ATCC BAA-2073 / JCM 16842 / OB47) TaxID=608506 RepID=D9THI8_CALOO|nr:carbohydrate ABC transporter permease [Caldicellulosiruptor obsidiansis]ADL41553.1 binding-protein-dependent transport systems inner membrane component [Caldicellulosiruptor obsidiansis OB47]